MSMTETFAAPDDFGDIHASDLHESLGGSLLAQGAEALDPQSGISAVQLWRRARSALAGGEALPGLNMPETPSPLDLQVNQQARDEIPDTSIADAKTRVKEEGLDGLLPLPDQASIKTPVLDLMIAEAHEHRDRQTAIARGPQGFLPDALGFATSIGAGMIDPVNIAAFSVPVLGEARWGKMLLNAGDSLAARTGVRVAQGAVQGAAGTALLQPADWLLHTADGRDYTFAEALRNVALGAAMGGVFHAGLGALSDLKGRLRGEPLPGSTEDLQARAAGGDLTAAVLLEHRAGLAGEAPAGDEMPGVAAGAENAPAGLSEAGPSRTEAEADRRRIFAPLEGQGPAHPADVFADLPQGAREDVVRASVANLIEDRPNNAAEMLQEAAKEDPRIAESVRLRSESAVTFNGRTTRLVDGGQQDGKPQSLLEFLAARGGVSDKDPLVSDLLQSFGGKNPTVRGYGRLVREGGQSLDRLREAAVEARYLEDAGEHNGGVTESTINHLLDAVDTEARGTKVYPQGEAPGQSGADVREEAARQRDQHAGDVAGIDTDLDAEIAGRELGGNADAVKSLAFRLMTREGETDPRRAVDRALATIERSREPAAKADWQSLAGRPPAYDEPQTAAISKLAEATTEPASVDAAKAPAAAEKSALDADQLLKDMPLSDKERRAIEEVLGQLDRERDERSQIIKEGAACLAAAVA